MKGLATITKFSQFIDHLEKEIRDGKYPPGAKLPSERDFGKDFRIAHMTVNKAIASLEARGIVRRVQGVGTFVNEKRETQERTVGAIIDTARILHAPFPNILPGLFQQKGYYLTVLDVGQGDNIKKYLPAFLAEKPRALIVDGYSVFPFESIDTISGDTALVFINRFEGSRKYDASTILFDYRAAGRMAVETLAANGRNRTALLSYRRNPGWTSELFYQGCMDACTGNATITEILTDEPSSASRLEELFSKPGRPDSIISFGDARVIPLLKKLPSYGLRVPDDVAVVGFQNSPWAESYQMTSISLEEQVMAETALAAVEDGGRREWLIAPRLVTRETCPKGRRFG